MNILFPSSKFPLCLFDYGERNKSETDNWNLFMKSLDNNFIFEYSINTILRKDDRHG